MSLLLVSVFLFASVFQAGVETLMASFKSTWHTLESSLRREPHLRECLPKIWLYGIFLLSDSYGKAPSIADISIHGLMAPGSKQQQQ